MDVRRPRAAENERGGDVGVVAWRPHRSGASAASPEKLARCWHPVAYGHEVTDKPVAATLLGEAVVVWRTSDGRAHAMRDLCIHRGTALSLGWIADDCLVCPYHAWRYDASGRVRAHPAVGQRHHSVQGAHAV